MYLGNWHEGEVSFLGFVQACDTVELLQSVVEATDG
jgi:hypothetical protein